MYNFKKKLFILSSFISLALLNACGGGGGGGGGGPSVIATPQTDPIPSTTPTTPTPAGTGKLPDTGITANQCFGALDGISTFISCTGRGAIALNSQQDGMVGRDVTNNDNTDGKAGFSYSLVPNPSGAAGSNFAKTSCVKDNITGLIWEGKPADGGLRDFNKTYTNYGDGRVGDTSAYVAAVNAAGLCGATDWRLPTADELQGLVDYGVAFSEKTIDATWFPNTRRDDVWSSNIQLKDWFSPGVGGSNGSWYVSFYDGRVANDLRSSALSVWLVRVGQ